MGFVPIFREWTFRLLGALRPHRRDSEIEEELQLHLEMEAEKASPTAQVTKKPGVLRESRWDMRHR